MKKILLNSLLLTGVSTPFADAQSLSTDVPVDLPELVVTATRSNTTKNQLSAATTVYTRSDIERLQVKTLPDLLRGTTGVDITQQGGDGKITSVFMRGTSSDNVLVLIDGIKFGSVSAGTSPFEFVPIDQIERIEIVRGPQSSLYGSEAVGGVIQIFTRKGGDTEKPRVTLDTGGGSYNSLKASGTISGKWKNSWYSAGASHYNTEGFNAQQTIPGSAFNNPDKDGYYNTSVNARIGHRFDNNTEIEATFLRSQGRTNYDGFFNKTKFINQVASLTGSIDLTDAWRSTLRLGQSFDDNNNFSPASTFGPASISTYNNTRWNATWLNKLTLSDKHQLVFGSDYRFDELASTDAFTKTSRYDVGAFGELHSQLFDNHFINASLRYDKNQQSGSYVTGNFGWRYNSPIGISPFASFGNAFKAPSFNDLYYPQYGNPNLQPEKSTTFEVGATGTHDWGKWELRAYHTNIDNLIAPVLVDPVNFIYHAENLGKAQIDGLEAEISTQVLGWNTKLGMSLMNPIARETNLQIHRHLRLPRRSDKTLSLDVSRSFNQVDVGATVLAQDGRFDDPANTTKVAGYVTVNLSTAYHFNKNWILSAKLNNLLDKQYQTVNTYNTADRNFFISIHYNN